MPTTPTKPGPTAAPSPNYILPVGGGGGTPPPPGTDAVYNLPTGTSPFAYPVASFPPNAGGPNDPNYPRTTGPAGPETKDNLGMIVGVTVAGVVVLAMVGLLMQRYRSHSRNNTLNSHQTRSRPRNNQTAAAGTNGNSNGDDRAKLAKSFTIRKPPSVYVEDDQDLDQTGHPRYRSDGDAQNHPYYGDRTPGLVEYELSDTSGQKYGPSSVAERKRYVEQQQRKVMDEYEMFNPHKDVPPPSPYPPSQTTVAPSYTSGHLSPPMSPPMTPSMGGRSPRVHHPSQTHSPFGRTMQQQQQHDSTNYNY